MGSIVSGAFRNISEKPGAVAVWAVIYFVLAVATTFVMRPILAMQADAMVSDPAVVATSFWSAYSWLFLFQLFSSFLFIVMYAASMRAELRPEEGGPAFLRLGRDELRLFGLAVFLTIIFYVGMVVAVIALVAVLAPFLIAQSAGGTPGAGTSFIVVLVPLLFLLAAFCFYVRLSLSFPLTLLRRKIIIGESWQRTRGHFWALLGAYLVILLIVIVIYAAVASVTAAPMLTELLQGGFDPENAARIAEIQLQQVSAIGPMALVGWVLNGIGGGLMVALFGGASAAATRQLAGEEFLARTFD